MAFFEDLGQKASAVSAKAIQKGKDLSDTTRLNSAISEEGKIINDTYHKIGKLYFTMHANDGEEQFQGLITTVEESMKRIQFYREQLQQIRGTQRCETCGAEVPRGAGFCSSCGAPMPKAANHSYVNYFRCPACGASVEKQMLFCAECGNPLTSVSATPEQQTSTDPIPAQRSGRQPSPIPSDFSLQVRRCPNCDQPVDDDSLFCPECGTPLAFQFSEDQAEPDPVVGQSAPDPINTPEPTSPPKPLNPSEDVFPQRDVFSPERIAQELPDPEMPAASQMNTCAQCGTELDADAIFCFNCGASVSNAASTNTVAENRRFSVRTCPHCGADMDSDALFCAECGKKV